MGLFDKNKTAATPFSMTRTPDQKKVIKYFTVKDGCFSGKMKDTDYDQMVADRLNSLGVKFRALNALGIDAEEVNELEPINFHGWESDTPYRGVCKDGRYRSAKYSDTWLFFSENEVHVYKIVFDMTTADTKETTELYFYKDITNFATRIDDDEYITFSGCKGKKLGTKMMKTTKFALTVPGDNFYCSTTSVANAEEIIAGMKQKLRDKKNNG